jgi:hypothetical protein
MCARKAHIGIGSNVPASVPKRSPSTILQQPTPTTLPMKNGPETIRFQARSVISGDLSKPPPSASRPPHRVDSSNDLNDPPCLDPIVQFVVQ